MALLIIAFLGGMLTIWSPCILPVIPFVFARSDRSFVRSGLPLLAGLVVTFAAVSTLAAVGGSWVGQANETGRKFALVLFALFGLSLLFPQVAERITRPLVRVGSTLSAQNAGRSTIWQSFVLGIATGFLWAPCAGPILGFLLTSALIGGPTIYTALTLVAFGFGAAASLAVVLFGGQKLFTRLKSSLGFEEKVRKGLGVAIILGVALVASGLDRSLLTKLSEGSTASLEDRLLERIGAHPAKAHEGAVGAAGQNGNAITVAMTGSGATAAAAAMKHLPVEGKLQTLPASDQWINSPALSAQSLRGKVVLIDFWTYSCINCLRTLPSVKSWYQAYKDKNFVVVGVHTPEFAFERDRGNVEKAVRELGITYPVGLDNDYGVWRAFNNEYWPAHYLVDTKGNIRYHHFGEGSEAQTEAAIRSLIQEAGMMPGALAKHEDANGAMAEAGTVVQSPETYLGTERAANFAGIVAESARESGEKRLKTNGWQLSGKWTRTEENAHAEAAGSAISFRFHARDAHLVLGPGAAGKEIRYKVLLDGQPVGDDHGADIDSTGSGLVREQRLYQLVRQKGEVRDRVLTILFEDPGVDAYAFTFG